MVRRLSETEEIGHGQKSGALGVGGHPFGCQHGPQGKAVARECAVLKGYLVDGRSPAHDVCARHLARTLVGDGHDPFGVGRCESL